MNELNQANFSYPHIKADLALCENQLDALCNARPVEEASMHIPAVETDFDMQFQAAFDELKAYRKTKLTSEQLEGCTAPKNKPNVSEISVAKAIKRIEDLIGILDIRIGWGDAQADILSEKRDYELAIAALRNYGVALENKPLTLEQLRKMDGQPVWVVGKRELKAGVNGWMLINIKLSSPAAMDFTRSCNFADYGKLWLAYAREPARK